MSLTESNTGEQTILDTVAAQVLLHTGQELLSTEMPNPRWPVSRSAETAIRPLPPATPSVGTDRFFRCLAVTAVQEWPKESAAHYQPRSSAAHWQKQLNFARSSKTRSGDEPKGSRSCVPIMCSE